MANNADYEPPVDEEQKVKDLFEENLNFLQKFVLLLSLHNGEEQRLISGKQLALISKEYLNFNDVVLFNIPQIYYDFKLELGRLTGNYEIDINTTLLESFGYCLTFILNMISQEKIPQEQVIEILQYFKHLNKCIFIFSTTQIIIDTAYFKDIVNAWIVDLIKIITGADGFLALNACKFMIFNVIKHILISIGTLAKCEMYREKIINEICKRFKCVISYSTANEYFFTDCVFIKTMVLEYFLWTLRDLLYHMATKVVNDPSENLPIARVRLIIDQLDKCIGDTFPGHIKRFIEDILKL